MFRYGISRVYSQQCGYTLLDVQAMHDKMRQTLRSVPAGGLDPSAGKARLVSLKASQLARGNH